MSLHDSLERIWYGPAGTGGAAASALRALSFPYRLGLGLRERLYEAGAPRRRSLPAPCVAVGNLTVGGTGKTPAVSWIVDFFLEAGLRPAVISRGYGGSSRGPRRAPPEGDSATARLFGDEPAMLAARHRDVPVVIGRDRVAAGRKAVALHGADILVADDAFQHFAMARDLDVVVVDAGRWFGNGLLLPGGPLREPPASLRRAGVVLLNRVASAGGALAERREELRRLAPGALTVEADVVPSGWRPFGERARRGETPPQGAVFGFCGLGNPSAFRRTLSELPWTLGGWRSFPDHHRYSPRDLEEVGAAALTAGAVAAVTTEKDAVRIGTWRGPLPLFVLEVRLRISAGREELEGVLSALARGGAR